MEKAIELLLRRWLAHSRNVRISVLESINDRDHRERWRGLKQFIQQYGQDLFNQKFMNFANLRAILHQGVDHWLRSLEEDEDPESHFRLIERSGSRHSPRGRRSLARTDFGGDHRELLGLRRL